MVDFRKYNAPKNREHRASYEQMDPGYEIAQMPENYGGGLYARRKQETEAPLLDPMDPFLLPKTLPAKLAKSGLAALKGYGKLGFEAVARGIDAQSPLLAMAMPQNVVKHKGGNWLSGSVEDALGGLKKSPPIPESLNLHPELEKAFIGTPELAESQRRARLNNWIDKQLTRYVKNEMATPEDPIRALAERGVLHYEPAPIRERSPLMEKIVGRRETAGFPIQGLGDSPVSRNWENTSDSIVRNLEARDLSSAERAASFGGKSNIPGDTTVHEMNPFASGIGIADLGFPHLIDELSNATNPASGLPRELLLDPTSLSRVSVPQAVERVAKINAWRAAQKAEADALKANNAATVLHKEYPDDPRGLRWVQLKGRKTTELSPEEVARYEAMKENDAIGLSGQLERELADALRYEGDTMGHCVGGYCDDVLSGRSNIYSLRDSKGQPHVTIETAPPSDKLPNPPDDVYTLASKQVEEMQKTFTNSAYSPSWGELVYDSPAYKEWLSGYRPAPRIVQIKGKQNRKPNDEYLPFVQDFVRSGKWSDVGDLQNTGLMRHPKTGEYLLPDEYKALPDNYGMAKGGVVAPDKPRYNWDTFFTAEAA